MSNCPSDEQIDGYIRVGGGADLSAEVRRHAQECNACRGRIEDALELEGLLWELREAVSDETVRIEEETGAPNLIGRRLGHFTLMATLGVGGMGTVYRAWDEELRREVALKVLPAELDQRRPEAIRRFQAEWRAAAMLSHPNVVTVHQVDYQDGLHYGVMELVTGGSAAERLRAQGRLDLATATQLIRGVVAALAAAHRKGIIHRDVKPSNILLAEDGQPKLADFGLARTSGAVTQITQPGIAVGSPLFMSPEQIRGESVGSRSDVYSLGATYYALLTGHGPFDRGPTEAVMYRHVHEPAPDPRREVPDLPDGVRDFILRCLAKDPAERFADGSECCKALDELGILGPIEKRPPNRRGVARFGALAVGVSALAVALWFAASSVFTDTRSPPDANGPGARQPATSGVLLGSITNSVGMELRLVPAGHFEMGSPLAETDRDEDEEQPHRVEIPRLFYIGTCEVTNAQYRRFMPSHDSGSYEGHTLNHDDQPVVNVSWHDAVAFCEWLSRRENATYRLPKEAEWEYACRARTSTPFSWGSVADGSGLNFADKNAVRFGWSWADGSMDDGYAVTAPVGSYSANNWGLQDMHGNVWEWCQDSYGGVPPGQGASPGSEPAATQSLFVIRGGAWNEEPRNCRAANRSSAPADTQNAFLGFRVVRQVK